MRRALDVLGPHLRSLPDGEIGDRSDMFPVGNRRSWVMYAIERLTADRENWQVVKEPVRGSDGIAVDYASIQKLKPRRSPRVMAQHVAFGYDEYARRSYAIFDRLRHDRGFDGLQFQMGVPTGFAMGFAFSNPIDWIRYTASFNDVIAREVNAVLRDLGDVVVQIEVPPELFAAYKLRKPLMSLALRPIYDLVGKITPGARIGIHLCLGDFHNEAMVHPRTLHLMAEFSNRLVAHWPSAYELAYMHYPLAEGAIPPRLDPAFYEPLGAVELPPRTRFVAGFVHEALSLDEHRRVQSAIETARRQEVDVACSCGLGRRTPEAAEAALELTRQLVDV
jgi:hypothetical protein